MNHNYPAPRSITSRHSIVPRSLVLLLAAALGACGGGGGGGGSSGGSSPPPPSSYTVGGTVSGLVSSGLVLQVNGGDNYSVPAKGASFTFSSALASGAAYAVTVLTQPSNPAQTCTVTSGSGTVGSGNVTSVSIACTAPVGASKYTVGGTISGLTSSGLVLADNVGDHLNVKAGSTTFTLPTSFASGSTYTVSVSTQPSSPAQVCTVAKGSGTVGSANVATVAITCATPTYKIGGTISGLTSGGLVLQDNAGDNLTVPANVTTFTFATGLKTGATYAATILTQPSAPAEVCTVTNGTGTVASAPITSITVSCARVGQFVLVANSLGGANNLGTVSAFAINSTTGALTAAPASPFALGTNDSDPTGIAVDESGHAYVTNTGSSNISFFEIGSNGALSFQGDYGTSGTVGAAIAVSASGVYAYTAGSSTASASSGSVSGFTITSSTGALTLTPNVPYSAGNPLVGIAIDPAAQLVFTTQGSTDFITAYLINSDGSLTGANGDPLSTGLAGSPAGVVTSPLGTSAGGFLYVANPVANSVSGYSYVTANAPPTASGNLLTPVPGTTQGQTGVFLTEGNGPTGIAIDPTGKYLYVTNFQDGTVSSFSIDSSGTLSLIGSPVATGNINGANPTPGPIAVQVDPSGKFVYVVNQQDDSLSVFSSAAGTLTLLMTYQCDVGAAAVAVE